MDNLLAMPAPQRSRRETIARALQGFGAGAQGQGQQFLAGVQAQDQALSTERQRAMAQDAMQVYQMLGSGRYDDALDLMDQRVKLIGELGGDPSDTVELRQKVATGDLQGAMGDLQIFLGAAQQAGLIPMPEKQEEYTLSPGQQRFRGDQVIASVAPADARQYRQMTREEVVAAGLDPERGYQVNEQTRQITAIGGGPAAVQTINMPTPEDKATEEFGKLMGTRAGQRIDAAAQAQNQNQTLMRMSEAIASGAQTGLGQQTLLDVKNLAQSLFGIQLGENVGEQEVVRALGNRLAMEVRNPASGLGLTGATSNRDLDFLIGAIPGLQRTPQGNALLIEQLMKQNQFKVDIANEQQRIIDENNGVVPRNLDTQLMRYMNNYQFVDDDFRRAIDQATSQTAQQPASRFTIEVIP
jgi:hypothetical protein